MKRWDRRRVMGNYCTEEIKRRVKEFERLSGHKKGELKCSH